MGDWLLVRTMRQQEDFEARGSKNLRAKLFIEAFLEELSHKSGKGFMK